MRKLTFLGAAVIAAAPLAVSAQTLEIATDQSPAGLDPHVATAFSTKLINDSIYEGLTAIDSDLRVIPALAESWSVSDDQRTYTFKLRSGLNFHNGEAFDAGDVVFSINRVLDENTGSPIASRFNLITDASGNGDEVVVTLSDPFAPFLGQLATLHIVPADYVGGGGDLARTAVGTGPFSFGEWVPDTSITLNANAAYWDDGLPKVDALKFNIVPEGTTRQIGLSTNVYQLLPNIDASIALSVQNQPDITVLKSLDLSYSLIGMNTTIPPFDDPKVREALNYAIDRKAIAAAAYFGEAQPAGPVSPALVEWAVPTEQFSCYAHDPEKAKALLAEAGHTAPVSFTLKALGSLQLVVDISQVVQAQLNEAGFDVDLDVQELGVFVQDWKASNFQAFASLNGGNVDPDGYFYRTFRTGGSTNVFKYANEELDGWLDAARVSGDAAERKSLYDNVQNTLACQGPIAHLNYGTLFTATRADVSGYELVADRSLRYLRQTALGQ
ncbi:MAG: ABC transporter substrate-binding protein [Alphaproteobacteria bacterium]